MTKQDMRNDCLNIQQNILSLRHFQYHGFYSGRQRTMLDKITVLLPYDRWSISNIHKASFPYVAIQRHRIKS